MRNSFCRTPLWEAAKTLTAVAQGQTPAELVIKGATLVNVCTGELLEHIDVACSLGRIAYVGPDAGQDVYKRQVLINIGATSNCSRRIFC